MVTPRHILPLVAASAVLLATEAAFPQDRETRFLTSELHRGIRALKSGYADRAAAILASVNERHAGFHSRELGSAALWHGRAVEAQGRPHEAVSVWADGWRAVVRRGVTDVDLGLEFIWRTFEHQRSDYYEQAANVYLTLIEHVPDVDPEAASTFSARLLEPLSLIVPAELQSVMSRPDPDSPELLRLAPGAGRRIADWWRSMDALPATTANERLIEHLRRVVHAAEHYPGSSGSPFDDRGRIYIRFGTPGMRHSIDPPRSGFLRSERQTPTGLRVELTNKPYTFPRNEYWVYRNVGDEAQYLFVAGDDGEYRLGTTYDVLPIELRTTGYSLDQLDLMENVLRDLALYHPDTYEHAYTRVSNFRNDTELDAFAEYHHTMIGLTFGDLLAAPGSRVRMDHSVSSFVRMAVTRYRSAERKISRRRDEVVPPFYFDDFSEIDRFPVQMRWARFLTPEGETRTRIFWTARKEDVLPRSQPDEAAGGAGSGAAIDLTAVRYDERFQGNVRNVKRTRFEDLSAGGMLTAQEFSLATFSRDRSLGLQWDVFVDNGVSAEREPDQRVKLATVRIENLEPLRNSGRTLEMSDLVPIRFVSDSFSDWEPYPERGIHSEMRLGLNFEIYHLRFGEDDRTHYTVSYEVAREGRPLIRTRATDPAEVHRTRTTTRRGGTSSVAEETIQLDVQEWHLDGELEVVVRVRDEVSGQETRRSLRFELTS